MKNHNKIMYVLFIVNTALAALTLNFSAVVAFCFALYYFYRLNAVERELMEQMDDTLDWMREVHTKIAAAQAHDAERT